MLEEIIALYYLLVLACLIQFLDIFLYLVSMKCLFYDLLFDIRLAYVDW